MRYYSSLGVKVPRAHVRLAMLERWAGYIPVGFFACRVLGFSISLLIFFGVLSIFGPIELFVMMKGFGPWRFMSKKPPRTVVKVFALESYNTLGYFLLGSTLALFW